MILLMFSTALKTLLPMYFDLSPSRSSRASCTPEKRSAITEHLYLSFSSINHRWTQMPPPLDNLCSCCCYPSVPLNINERQWSKNGRTKCTPAKKICSIGFNLVIWATDGELFTILHFFLSFAFFMIPLSATQLVSFFLQCVYEYGYFGVFVLIFWFALWWLRFILFRLVNPLWVKLWK